MKTGLICFDINGTLIHENTWKRLNKDMGITPEEDQELLTLYAGGSLPYQDAQKNIESLYKQRGRANKKSIEQSVCAYTYKSGVTESVAYLKAKGYTLCVISGSMDVLASHVANALGIALWAANNQFIYDESGAFLAIRCHADDRAFKAIQLQKFQELLGIPLADCYAVGDDETDTEIFTLTGHGVTFIGSPLVPVAWKIIPTLTGLRHIF